MAEASPPVTSLTKDGLSNARSTRTSPPPIRVIGAAWSGNTDESDDGWNTFGSAVLTRICLMSSGDSSGRAALRMAAEPVTIGAAPEVPPNAEVAVKPPDLADTDAPGAPISGLTRLSSKRGPREDVEASEPASGNEDMRMVAPPRIAFASARVIM